jgi:hypothetical protein
MSTPDSGLGPISFALDFIDTFDTLDPQAPISGAEVNVEVSITVNWNIQRSALENEGVTFEPIVWTKSGPGPHDVFADQLGQTGRQKVGAIQWSITNKVEKWTQKDGSRFRPVVTVTPILMMTRRTIGISSPSIEVRQSRPTPCYGSWQNIPAGMIGA